MSDYIEISCIGDSIANGFSDETGKGWVMRLLEKLNAQKPYGYYLNNFARSGDRSCDAFHKLCHSVVSTQPDVLLISVGTNDLIHQNAPDGDINLSYALREQYWHKILTIAQQSIKSIYVFGLIPVDESTMPYRGSTIAWWYNKDIAEYNSLLEKLCGQYGIPFFNFYDGFAEYCGNDRLYDGLHPDAQGHEWMSQFAFEKLKGRI